MGRSGIKRMLMALLLGASALLVAGEAAAVRYTGEWGATSYNGLFPSLGWRATATFDLPSACLALGNSIDVSVSAGPCAGATLLAAQVQLFNIVNPAATVGTYALDTDFVLTAVDIAAGALTGVETVYFDRFVPSLALAGGGAYSFSLILFNDRAQLAFARPAGTSLACLSLPVADTDCGFSANDARGVFTAIASPAPPIPEPETWAMMITGLAAIGAMARRRRVAMSGTFHP